MGMNFSDTLEILQKGFLWIDRVCRRGKSGGQVRDEYRDEYDPGRGGYGRAIAEERLKEEEEYGKGR